jgi:hypothetical protein
MRNCPDDFYLNCSEALIECYRCVAGLGNLSQRLRYKPINAQIEHPYTTAPAKLKVKDLNKSRQVKTALKREQAAVPELARATLASGRLRHDGDAVHLDALRVERKTRFKSRAVSVTSKELVKGKQQQINVFEIDLPLCRETYYVLTQQTYIDLISYVYSSRNSSLAQEEVSRTSDRRDDSRS